MTFKIDFLSDATADRLVSFGYQHKETYREFSADGSVRMEWAVQSLRPRRVPNGSPEFTAPANLAGITLCYPSDNWPEKFSKVAGKFADALVRLLATPDGPLVRRTARSLEFLYRFEASAPVPRLYDASADHTRELFAHGLVTRDSKDPLELCAGCPEVPISADDTSWLNRRSPLTVPRAELPEWDEDAVSAALAGLVETWVAAGDLTVCGETRLQATAPTGQLLTPSDYL